MHFNTANLLFIQILYCFPLHHSENNIFCPATQSEINDVSWPSTSSTTHSQPLCVDTSKKLIQRSCNNGEWGDDPHCDFYQDEEIPECAEGFTDTSTICYKITKPSEFQTGCPFEDSITFDIYEKFIPSDSPPIWVPVTRNLDNGLGFLQWIDPNHFYKSDFTLEYEIQPPIIGKNCVILYPANGTMAAVSCIEKFSHFCAYKKLGQHENRLCRTKDHFCVQSDFSPKSKCFCLGDSSMLIQDYQKVTFLKKYQNHMFSILTKNTDDQCLIGIEKKGGTYFWTGNKEQINYTNWSPDTIFDETHVIGAMKSTGWILLESNTKSNCVLYEEEVDTVESNLTLDYSKETNNLRISVKNKNGLKWLDDKTLLLYCFTDAGAFNLIYRYPLLSEIQTINEAEVIYEFTPHAKGPGNYWCESTTYPHMKPIRSNTKFYRNPKFVKEFVAIIKSKYIDGYDPLSYATVELLERVLFLKLDENEYLQSHYSARIMKIIDLDEVNNFIRINVHLTTKGNVQSNDDGWENIESILKEIFKELEGLKLELEDFRSVDECFQETTNEFNLTWKTTKVGKNAYPNEWCIVDGQRLERWCRENFESGAEWEPITKPCNLWMPVSTEQSDITNELCDLLNTPDSGKFILEKLRELSERYSEFKEIDLFFYGQILVKNENETEISIYDLIEILNNLLAIDTDLLISAQEHTQSSDRILGASNIIFISNLVSNDIILNDKRSNFQLISDIVCNGNNKEDFYNCVLKENDFEFGLLLSVNSISEVRNSVFILKTYINSAFFIVDGNTAKIIGPVFVLDFIGCCKEYLQTFTIAITYFLQEIPNKLSCDLWHPATREWLKNVGTLILKNSVAYCQFDRVGTFALREVFYDDEVNNSTPHPSSNVTSDLSDLIESNATTHEVIETLLNISTRYDEFTEDAVYLTAQILKKISNGTDLDLNAIAEIVSNLHEVNRTVLANSQTQNQSTDLILFTVDEIINSYEYTDNVEIVWKNFLVLVSDLGNISGIILYKTEDNTISYTVLDKDTEINVNDWENVEAAVILSKDLMQQFTNDSKIIITFHTSDALFNEKQNGTHLVSKIFGIILPDLHDEVYKGPLYVFHNLSKSGWSDDCVHWFYDQVTNRSGMWQSDPDRTKLGDFFQCDYWHTTHFALLLLPNDLELPLLDLITMINCSLSGFGLVSIILTAILFKRWRMNTGNQILLNFVFAITIQIATLYISNAINKNFDDDLLCTIIGVVLHYSLISQFCWMFIIAILQFKRLVEVFGGPPKYVLVKACLCGWVLPLLPVVCVFALDNDNYSNGHVGLCYPSGLGLYLGVWLPIVIIVVINTVIFIYILYNVLHKKTEYVSKQGNSDILVQWRLAILLFFMLGLTWTFGFLGQFDYGTIFIYLFSCSATLQGFVMFLFFIVFNKNTRLMYSHGFKTCCRRKL